MSDKSQAVKETTVDEGTLLPPVDVIEDLSGITLYADLPGVPKDKLNIEIETGTLTIEGELALALPAGIESTHAEIAVPRYRRVFSLSKDLDPERIVAEFEQGVLKLRIPKTSQAQPRKIAISVD